MMDGALPAEPDYKALINRAPLMIFMKGNRDEPRCGFSRTLIGILNETGLDYETFDIFSDEDVRQGLKKFSNWPTYPQVYVKGDLVGGLDIIKELQESDELISTLKGEWKTIELLNSWLHNFIMELGNYFIELPFAGVLKKLEINLDH